jgi:hypothetical protein
VNPQHHKTEQKFKCLNKDFYCVLMGNGSPKMHPGRISTCKLKKKMRAYLKISEGKKP